MRLRFFIPMMKSTISTFFIILALAGCSQPSHTQADTPETISNVAVATVQRVTVPEWLETVGTVRAAQTSQISSQMTGNITEIKVAEGDFVTSGQVLARIDDAQPRSTVEQDSAALLAAEKSLAATETDLTLAESTLKRYEQLREKEEISAMQYDQAKAQFQSAEARRDMARATQTQASSMLEQAKVSLAYAEVRAPFSGLITEKKLDPGAFAAPGLPIFTIEDTRNFRLEAAVDESDIGTVRIGQAVPVVLESLGPSVITGKVTQIVPAADPASRSFLVKISLPADKRIRSGLFGRAHFPRGTRSALMIPASSVMQRGQLQMVYAPDANQIAELRYVTLGKRIGDNVEILSGLQEGERLVADPEGRDLAGKRIATRP